MAKRVFLKIWSILISSLALFTADISSQSKTSYAVSTPGIWQWPIKRQKPELFLQSASAQEDAIVVAAHRSHSSHRSHASHASHASHVSGVSSRSAPVEPSNNSTENEKVIIPSQSSVVPSRIPSTTTIPKSQSATPLTKSQMPSSNGSKIVYMKNGAFINCESIWIAEGKLFFSKDGKTFSLPINEIDLQRTSIGTNK